MQIYWNLRKSSQKKGVYKLPQDCFIVLGHQYGGRYVMSELFITYFIGCPVHIPISSCPKKRLLFSTDLQSNRKNREYLKYLRNFYWVTTNHSKDQDTRARHTTNLVPRSHSVLRFLAVGNLGTRLGTKPQANQHSCLRFSFLTLV